MQAFDENSVPKLANLRQAIHSALVSPYPELGSLTCSTASASKEVSEQLNRRLLSISLQDNCVLGSAVQEVLQLLADIAVMAFVVKRTLVMTTPQGKAGKCAFPLQHQT